MGIWGVGWEFERLKVASLLWGKREFIAVLHTTARGGLSTSHVVLKYSCLRLE
jgi:hypothetical protein